MSITIKVTPASELVPAYHDKYVDTGILNILDKLAWRRPIVLKGPKGSGKTLALEQWAATQGIPMVRCDCSEDMGNSDLIGSYGVQGKEVYYGLGHLTTAIETANNEGGCLLVLEEVNALPPKVQKMLNGICDYRQSIMVSKIGRVFKVKPGHKIWVVGTMNPRYAGTHTFNEDLKSRWGFVHVGYMKEEKEKNLLLNEFSSPATASEVKLVDGLHSLAVLTRTNRIGDYALATRDLVHFIHDYEALGTAKALKVLEGKYEEDAAKDFRTQCMTLFKVNLEQVELIEHG